MGAGADDGARAEPTASAACVLPAPRKYAALPLPSLSPQDLRLISSALTRGAVWPKGYHAPGVQHHLRPLRAPTAGAGECRSSLETLEARDFTTRSSVYAARGLVNLVSAKPAELLPTPPQSRSQSQTALNVDTK